MTAELIALIAVGYL